MESQLKKVNEKPEEYSNVDDEEPGSFVASNLRASTAPDCPIPSPTLRPTLLPTSYSFALPTLVPTRLPTKLPAQVPTEMPTTKSGILSIESGNNGSPVGAIIGSVFGVIIFVAGGAFVYYRVSAKQPLEVSIETTSK